MPMRLASLLRVRAGEHFSSGHERRRASRAAFRFFQRADPATSRMPLFQGWSVKTQGTATKESTDGSGVPSLASCFPC